MTLNTRTLPLIALAGALLLTGCATNASGGSADDMPKMDPRSSSAPAEDTASGQVNDADVIFVQMMLPHHEQAVEMSDIFLAKDDVDPDVATLAQLIKDAQQPEIDQMTGLLTEWGQEASGMEGMDHSADGGMNGMMSDEDMTALEDAPGAEASTVFLEQMIQHHGGAVDMAQAEITDGENPDAIALAEQIVDTQQDEIERMQQLLAS